MFQLYQQGGALFMNVLTLLLILIVVFFVLRLISSNEKNKWYEVIKNLGIMALAVGILGQLIGLFTAMNHIESAGGVSTAIFAAGFKVSMITTMYGLIIFIISKLFLIIKPKISEE